MVKKLEEISIVLSDSKCIAEAGKDITLKVASQLTTALKNKKFEQVWSNQPVQKSPTRGSNLHEECQHAEEELRIEIERLKRRVVLLETVCRSNGIDY